MRASIDLTTFIIIGIVVASIAALVGFVGPKLTEAANTIADVQYAPARAQAKIENEQTLAQADAKSKLAQIEIDKLNAQSAADTAKAKAQIDVLKAQSDLETAKSNGVATLTRIDADSKTASQFMQGAMALVIGLIVLGGLWIGNLVIGNVMANKNELARIEAQKQLMMIGINKMAELGGEVTMDNGHKFTINKPAVPMIAAPNAPALPAPSQEPLMETQVAQTNATVQA